MSSRTETGSDCVFTQVISESSSQRIPQVSPVSSLPIFTLLQTCEVRGRVLEILQDAATNWTIGRHIARDLPSLKRLNFLDALSRNAFILNIPVGLIESDGELSPFFRTYPQEAPPTDPFPPHLRPTPLQQTVKHHPWLDLFPFPRMRDNILRGLHIGVLDEDQLADELVCDFLNLTASDTASLMTWGDSWDMFRWEFCPVSSKSGHSYCKAVKT